MLFAVALTALPPQSGARPPRGVTVPRKVLESYVGRYELVPGVEFQVSLEDGELGAQLTGQARYALVPEAETLFSYAVVDALLEFQLDDRGQVTGLVLHQGRTHQQARRLDISAPAPAAARSAPAAPDAAARFAALERRLLAARSIRFDAEIRAEGVLPSNLTGRALLARENRASLAFAGTFDRTPAQIVLVSDGTRMRGGAPELEFELTAPAALGEGLVLGLTRMGLLHNLAVMSSGSPPEGTDGRAREWVSVREFGWADSTELAERPAEVLRFEIVVAGAVAGQASLWLDPDSGLPVLREQTVRFPDGTMRVVEQYRNFELDVPAPDERFILPHDHDAETLDRPVPSTPAP
jgi:hypothetical protein